MSHRTPTTEAGRRHLDADMQDRFDIASGGTAKIDEAGWAATICDIEDEARAPLVAAVRNVIDHLDRGMFSSAVMVDLPMLRAALSREARP